MKNNKVIIYTRSATDTQAESGSSLDGQRKRLESYCTKMNYEIVQYCAEECSGKTFKRPLFKLLLEYLRQNKEKINFLFVTRWDRFSRNVTDSLNMIRKLSVLGIEVNAVEQPIDFTIPENKMMLSFYLTMPEVSNAFKPFKNSSSIRNETKMVKAY